jgi:hypothetical protein
MANFLQSLQVMSLLVEEHHLLTQQTRLNHQLVEEDDFSKNTLQALFK